MSEKKVKKNLGGRPNIELNKDDFERCCEIQCTQEEIADWFRCSADTVDRWCKANYQASFAEVFKVKRKAGLKSLRRAQWESAIYDKVPSMLIWLGKQYLGQSDKQDIDLKSEQIRIIIDSSDESL